MFHMNNSKATPKKHTDSENLFNRKQEPNKVGAYSTSYYDDEYDYISDDDDDYDDSDYNSYE